MFVIDRIASTSLSLIWQHIVEHDHHSTLSPTFDTKRWPLPFLSIGIGPLSKYSSWFKSGLINASSLCFLSNLRLLSADNQYHKRMVQATQYEKHFQNLLCSIHFAN